MSRAQKRDAIHRQKFYFRKQVFNPELNQHGSSSPLYPHHHSLDLDLFSSPHFESPLSQVNNSHQKLPFQTFDTNTDDEVIELTIDEIINGQRQKDDLEGGFPGLLHFIDTYLNSIDVDVETRSRLNRYLNLVGKRASGECKTAATWIRDFVTRHPSYGRDSKVTHEINYDLCMMIQRIIKKEVWPEELFGLNRAAAPTEPIVSNSNYCGCQPNTSK
jgi:glutamate--cysteine ligase catalytic subunit